MYIYIYIYIYMVLKKQTSFSVFDYCLLQEVTVSYLKLFN